MAKVKLGLGTLAAADKVTLARQIVTKMTGNVNFTTPVPPLASLTGLAGVVETADADAQGARVAAQEKTASLKAKEAALDTMLTQIGNYVESASAGNAEKILSAGIGVRGEAAAPTIPVQVQALAATAGDNEGEIDLVWDPADGAKSYSIDLSIVSGTGAWTNSRVVTKSSATISGLTTGGRVWFRVAAIGAAGQGPWSDPATKIVP